MKRELMYVENKDGDIDGASARVGWVTLSKTGRTVYYRGRSLQQADVPTGNHQDVDSGDKYWVSGVKKKRGSTVHYVEPDDIQVDDDALKEYQRLTAK